jgi:hypothetical protein
MREIKFRAWDGKAMFFAGEKEQMIRPSEDTHFYIWSDGWELGSLDGHLIASDKDCNLMQYTGLKDENGVEIYEGDILKTNSEEMGTVVFDQRRTQFMLKYADYKSVNDDIFAFTSIEVIGNIYENKELLDK